MLAFVFVIGALLAAVALQPKIPQAQKFSGGLEFPSIKEGRPIPVIFGTVDLKAPNVVWWGDWEQRAIKKDGQRIGYYQYAGAHLIFCHGPVDSIRGIYADKDKVIWEGNSTANQRIYIDKPSLFGNKKTGEGGVVGYVDIEFGLPNQGKNDYLHGQQGESSAHRGLFGLVLRQPKLGNTKAPKPWWARVTRIHRSGSSGALQWYDEKAQIGNWDMNPAHIVRECLLNDEWGAGEREDLIAPGTLEAFADLCYEEGLGLSMIWDESGDVYEFIESVLRQCNAAIFQEPKDGLYYITAARPDYVKENLQLIDRSSIIKVRAVSRPSPSEQVNTLTAKYVERERGETASVTIEDQAAVELYGPITDEVEYPGLREKDAVSAALARDLAVVSRSLRTVSMVCNRDANTLTLGKPFVLDHPDFNIDNVVMRVTEIAYGNGKRTEIAITCVEDAFSAPAPFQVVPPTTWIPPQTEPVEVTTAELVIPPRHIVRNIVSSADWDAFDPEAEVYMMLLAEIPATGMFDMDLLVNTGPGYEEGESTSFSPTIVTDASIGYSETTIPVSAFTLASRIVVGSLVKFGDEWMEITSVGAASVEVDRAVLNTLPQTHAQGARGYVVDLSDEDSLGLVLPAALSGSTTYVKPLVWAASGRLEDSSAVYTKNRTAPGQNIVPPPANILIDGVSLPGPSDYHTGDVALSWKRRAQDNNAADLDGWFSNGDYAGGPNGIVEVWTGDGSQQGSTLSGANSTTYTQATELADFGQLQSELLFRFYSDDGAGNYSEVWEWVSYRDPDELAVPQAEGAGSLGSGIFDGTSGIEVTE